MHHVPTPSVTTALEPALRVPTLVLEDGRPLPESDAIVWYFADGTPYLPSDAYERAQVLQWPFFEQNSPMPNIAVMRVWLRWARTSRQRPTMEKHLSTREFSRYRKLPIVRPGRQ